MDTNSPREVFFRVAADMFADGNFNWGRVVALFYFASKLVLKVGSYRAWAQRCTLKSEDLGVVRFREWREMTVYLFNKCIEPHI